MADDKHIKTVAVCCGAREGKNPVFREEAQTLGRLLGENGYDLVYGGGLAGLMGVVARAAHECGANIHGIMPECFNKAAKGEETLWQRMKLLVVKTIPDRKRDMYESADAAIFMATGPSGIDEFWHFFIEEINNAYNNGDVPSRPLIVINTNGFLTPIKAMLDNMVEEEFIRPERAAQILFVDTARDAVAILNEKNRVAPVPASHFICEP